MCHVNCCCREETKSGLMNLLIGFTIVNLILSVVAIFIRAAKTNRYDEALEYLEAINNGNLDSLDLNNCGQELFDDDIYCNIDGKRLKKPSQSVKNQSIFKNWNKIELALNISRAVITLPFLIFLIYVINKREMERLNLITICVILLIVISGLWIVIRALAISANQDIGLYEGDHCEGCGSAKSGRRGDGCLYPGVHRCHLRFHRRTDDRDTVVVEQ